MLETKFDNKTEEMQGFEQMLNKESKIVMEACGSWQYLYDYFDEKGFKTMLAHPTKTSTLVGFFLQNR